MESIAVTAKYEDGVEAIVVDEYDIDCPLDESISLPFASVVCSIRSVTGVYEGGVLTFNI